MDYSNKYFGDKLIKSSKMVERKSSRGKDVYELTYSDGRTQELPEPTLDACITENQSNMADLLNKWCEPITLEFIGTILEFEIPLEWIQHVQQKLQHSISMSMDAGAKKLWGKEYYNLTLHDVDKVLKQNDDQPNKPDDKNKKGGGKRPKGKD